MFSTENRLEPFIVEIKCKPTSASPQTDFCHCTACAVAGSEEEAVAMSCSAIMSHSFLVESVLGVALKSSLPQDEDSKLDEALYQQALKRNPQVCCHFRASDGQRLYQELHSLKSPPDNEKKQ